jgi:phosphatidylethanolamine-binding protein (PEBP) family uncharacterized protein
MQVRVKGRLDDYSYSLGIQTNPDMFARVATWKANSWAPPTAKSFTWTIQDPDTIRVTYFTAQSEGVHRVVRGLPYPN